jgi:hypothetical protein
VGADHCDPGGDGVVALGLGTDHGLIDPSGAALEHPAVAVDQQVVADVVPAEHVSVVVLHAAYDRGGLVDRVVVGRDRVVHEGQLNLAEDRGGARRLRAPL